MNEEATDYGLHFCGLDCYAKWKGEEKLAFNEKKRSADAQ
jgi:hypothetical protein